MARKKPDKHSTLFLSGKRLRSPKHKYGGTTLGPKKTIIKTKNKGIPNIYKKIPPYKLTLLQQYRHNSGIHVFKFKITVPNTDRETFMGVFNKLIDYSIKDYPNGRIKIVPIHDIIKYKHDHWPIRTYDTVKELFLEQVLNLLNSAEELDVNDVVFEVTIMPNRQGRGKVLKILNEIKKRSIIQIKNNDTICLARAIVTTLAFNKLYKEDFTETQIKYIKEGRALQKILAIELHEKANVEIKEKGNDFDDLKVFENYLNIRIIVFASNSMDHIAYSGNEEYKEQIYLYCHNQHYDVVASITGFLAKRGFCKTCLIGYRHQHTCSGVLQSKTKKWECKKCNKTFCLQYQKPETHKCGEKTCFICWEKYMGNKEAHLCYMKPASKKK